ncbi:MAG: hypothetical protein MJ052_03560 [Sphaerochaetaceae bacterium]|nr:hypothetical protein [Sphaerochaetaceae bacterium]
MKEAVKFWIKVKILRTRYLHRCFILIAAITIPLTMALIFTESMMSGIAEKFITVSDGHLQVNGKFSADDETEKYISRTDVVCSGPVLLYSKSGTASLLLKGVNPEYFTSDRLKHLRLNVLDSNDSSSELPHIIISSVTAKKLSLLQGDRVALLVMPNGTDSNKNKTVMRPVLCVVSAIYSTGYNQLDETLAFTDFDFSCGIFPAGYTTEIIVKAKYTSALNEVRWILNTDLPVSTWKSKHVSIYENFEVSRQIILLVLFLVIVIEAFYCSSVSSELVNDSMRQISIVKMLGLSPSDVRLWAFFSVETTVLFASLSGLALGLILSFNIKNILNMLSESVIETFSSYLLDFSVIVPYGRIFIVMSAMIIISSFFVFISLRRSGRIPILQLFTET